MTDTREKEKKRDGDDSPDVVTTTVVTSASGRPSGMMSRHLTVDSCGTSAQRHLWARHTGRPGQPLVARLRVRPQSQLSCPETEATDSGVEGQQRSRSSDGGLAQHRRRRLVLKTINRSWPTSVTAPRDPRSANIYLLIHLI